MNKRCFFFEKCLYLIQSWSVKKIQIIAAKSWIRRKKNEKEQNENRSDIERNNGHL